MKMTRQKIAEYVYTGRPCKNGHIGPRYKTSRNCVQCLLERERLKQSDPSFAEAKRIRENNRYATNPEPKKLKYKEYYDRNKDFLNAKRREEHRSNPEIKARNLATWRRSYKNNRERKWVNDQVRRLRYKEARPPWADSKSMAQIKNEAIRLTRETGIVYSVDHIIPLHGKNREGIHIVCGLHCETNLQILSRSENSSKNCFTWPDMP